MRKHLPSKGFIGVAIMMVSVSIIYVLFAMVMVDDHIPQKNKYEVFFVLCFPLIVGVITAFATALVEETSKKESSDTDKGVLAHAGLQEFDDLIRTHFRLSDGFRRTIYLNEAESVMSYVCSLYDSMKCKHQKNAIANRLERLFPLMAADGLPVRSLQNLSCWCGDQKGALGEVGRNSLWRAHALLS